MVDIDFSTQCPSLLGSATTPFTDWLGWRRMRTAWQRRLFPMFTVLTWSRDFAEMSLAMRVAAYDCDLQVDLTVLRDLEVLFGLASFEAPDPDRTGNPLGILNIERIRDYREARNGRSLCVSDSYRTNLGYGIEPRYGSALQSFGLINANSCPEFGDELHVPMLPAKGDREKFADVARRWLVTIKTATKPAVPLGLSTSSLGLRPGGVLISLVRLKSRNRITPHDVRPLAAVKVSTERRFSSGGTMIYESD